MSWSKGLIISNIMWKFSSKKLLSEFIFKNHFWIKIKQDQSFLYIVSKTLWTPRHQEKFECYVTDYCVSHLFLDYIRMKFSIRCKFEELHVNKVWTKSWRKLWTFSSMWSCLKIAQIGSSGWEKRCRSLLHRPTRQHQSLGSTINPSFTRSFRNIKLHNSISRKKNILVIYLSHSPPPTFTAASHGSFSCKLCRHSSTAGVKK